MYALYTFTVLMNNSPMKKVSCHINIDSKIQFYYGGVKGPVLTFTILAEVYSANSPPTHSHIVAYSHLHVHSRTRTLALVEAPDLPSSIFLSSST